MSQDDIATAPPTMDRGATSLASRKFDFEDMINADPKCPIPALKIIRAYLRFVTDFDTDKPYVSIIDLQVATGLSTRAIIDNRNALVKLGYLEPAGKTGTGAHRYRLRFARESMVLDHMLIARETLRRIDAERKERQRQKRYGTLSEPDPVIEPNAGPDQSCDCSSHRDVIEPNAGNYLDNYLDGISSEEGENPSQVQNGLDPEGDRHIPFPVPSSADELAAMMSTLFSDLTLGPLTMARMRTLLATGRLTRAIVEGQRSVA
ncbi:hypothetical protein FJV76_29330 [Mesorhizobium sp. WSM4303]|uniref:hypothetical protein n=1 Tax=unclassified Mesorhizobium TaxID=325217 RepID=UPI00115D9382|nr:MULTISPECIES: hypothetical protein [unclassified Mesorhizobium]TRC92188.1 hypothetical protein FJV77_25915 [Mesorhizobium sp. WSM4306]TRC95576.1 hypothetical protein FJV76_29330 [Mesorhizobium sp. WSM4303]